MKKARQQLPKKENHASILTFIHTYMPWDQPGNAITQLSARYTIPNLRISSNKRFGDELYINLCTQSDYYNHNISKIHRE